ncbi:hypothetical protein QYF61_001952 [Mycteria americana]|uniref:Uncharacterized protein n=1 Tax=Mycteria americana TaxID=33587 RepID=A0AAN7MUZ1_MYCAM|nr:hypothetical protein QYF61_001952 [Mycteria americana]
MQCCAIQQAPASTPCPPPSCRQQLRDNTTRIHVHILAALLLLNCSFLLSMPLATGTKGLCWVTATLLHTSLLCALAWMAAEAFYFLLLLLHQGLQCLHPALPPRALPLRLGPAGLPALAVAAFVFKTDMYGYHTISTSEGYRNTTM